MPLLNTEKNLQSSEDKINTKFILGEVVRVTIYSNFPNHWYVGEVKDINHKDVVNGNCSFTEYYVLFKNEYNDILEYWFSEDELVKYSVQDDREEKINKLLGL